MMTPYRFPRLTVLLLGGWLLPGPVSAQHPPDNALTLELLQRIEQLETEVRQLRGDLDVYRHQIDLLRQQRMSADPVPAPRAVTPAPTPVPAPTSNQLPVSPPVVSVPSAPAPPPTAPAVAREAAQTDFDIALGELREGRYAQAIAGFEQFMNAHSGSTLASDAQYWLGEAYYLSRDYNAAKEAFINLGLNYPQSAKLPDALLKLGYLYGEQGDTPRARDVLQKLVQVYPNTPAARLAEQQLQSLR